MVELRAEDVKKELDYLDSARGFDAGNPLMWQVEQDNAVIAAARAWLASQATTEGRYVEPAGTSEQTPDYEAAARVLLPLVERAMDEVTATRPLIDIARSEAQAVVGAALHGRCK